MRKHIKDMKKIENIAIDKSQYYTRFYWISKMRWFFDRLFPRFYLWRLDRVIKKYERDYEKRVEAEKH
jgi:hypothetical protein